MKKTAYFDVENYADNGNRVVSKRETRDIAIALSFCKETPNSSVMVCNQKGSVLGTAYFSSKHPPSLEAIRKKVKKLKSVSLVKE